MTPWSALSRQAAATIEKTPIDPCVNLRPHGDQKFAGLDFRHYEVCFHQYAGVLIQPVKLLRAKALRECGGGQSSHYSSLRKRSRWIGASRHQSPRCPY